MPKVTVVIPAYNAEKYLLQTLQCLTAQSLQDFEALIVDDGSTDGTATIAARYAAEDPRMRLIQKENGGVSSARNEGIRQAVGTYILFLDSDDILTPGSLEAFAHALDRTGADLAIGRLQSFGAVAEKFNGFADALARCETIDKYNKNLLWNFLVGNKCYRLETLRRTGVTFPSIGYSEEGAFFMEFVLSPEVRRITGTMDANMRYRRHDPALDASVSQRVTVRLISDFLAAIDRIHAAASRALEGSPAWEAYEQEIFYKGEYVLLSQFYRLLWQTDDEMLRVIEQGHLRFLAGMTQATAARVRRLNADLRQLYFDLDTAAKHPSVSVILSREAADAATIQALYLQSMPLFDLFVPEGADVPARWRNCPNLHVLPEKGFRAAARRAAKGRCMLRLRKSCAADPRVLRFLLRSGVPDRLLRIGFTPLFRLVQRVTKERAA